MVKITKFAESGWVTWPPATPCRRPWLCVVKDELLQIKPLHPLLHAWCHVSYRVHTIPHNSFMKAFCYEVSLFIINHLIHRQFLFEWNIWTKSSSSKMHEMLFLSIKCDILRKFRCLRVFVRRFISATLSSQFTSRHNYLNHRRSAGISEKKRTVL